MARITVEDCQERVNNRFLLVQMTIKRVRQYCEGYEPLIESRNKEAVTALREIAAGKVLPDDMSLYNLLRSSGGGPQRWRGRDQKSLSQAGHALPSRPQPR